VEEAVERYFKGKPETYRIFTAVYDQLQSIGFFTVTVGSQISLGVNRKFAWFWLYNVTRRNPNGIRAS
jgi:hypothetical protein